MTIPTFVTAHPDPVRVELEIFVVAYLSDASGNAITQETQNNATYIKTELFNCGDEAWSLWDRLRDTAMWISCHDIRGESIV
jgi:hypothetical protein